MCRWGSCEIVSSRQTTICQTSDMAFVTVTSSQLIELQSYMHTSIKKKRKKRQVNWSQQQFAFMKTYDEQLQLSVRTPYSLR